MSYRDDIEALAQRCESLERDAGVAAKDLAETRRLLDQARQRARLPVLDNLHIAAPCKADWGKMIGDERTRFCAQCDKNVYNLSSMTRAQAEALLIEKEGKLCVRYYQRADGTILTSDCPDGVARRRRRIRIVAAGFGAMSALAAAASALSPRPSMVMMGAMPTTGQVPQNIGVRALDEAPKNIGVPANPGIEMLGGPRPIQGEVAPPPVKRPLMGKPRLKPAMGGAMVKMGDIAVEPDLPKAE